MKKLPIGIQTFSEIRQNNYVYVDKTHLAVEIILLYKYVLLSRPRRFGKNLFLDTLHNLFDGDMEQFENAIHSLFAETPYHNYTNNDIASYEGFYASVIFAWLSSSQLSLVVEDCTNKGRIDMILETDDFIF